MLVNFKEILAMRKDGEAIGSFNSTSIAAIKAVITAAEELERPVIVAHAEVHEKYAPLEIIGAAMTAAAKRASVPVCVLLDHGATMEYCFRAADAGFTGVMYDGSQLSYEENLANTKKVVETLHPRGINVEAELGTLNRHETEEEAAAITEPDVYTDPEVAAEFVEATGIDALAVAFGTAHGIYFEKPVLDIDRLSEVDKRVDIPLVMHGGSGISDEMYREVIRRGIEKINYHTYMSAAGGEAAKAWTDSHHPVYVQEILYAAEGAMRENVLRALKVFSGITD